MIYLWRFILGCVAACFFGLAALFFMAPLQPGDAPITGSSAIRTELESTADGAQVKRHFLPNGTSIATPLDWPLIPAETLHQFDRFGLAARAGNETRILLAVADAEDPERTSGTLILLDGGDVTADPVAKLQAFIDRIRPKLTQATVIHEAKPGLASDANTAWGGFRAVQEGRIGRRTVNARFDLIQKARTSLLAIQISMIGSRAGNEIEDMLGSLRVEG